MFVFLDSEIQASWKRRSKLIEGWLDELFALTPTKVFSKFEIFHVTLFGRVFSRGRV